MADGEGSADGREIGSRNPAHRRPKNREASANRISRRTTAMVRHSAADGRGRLGAKVIRRSRRRRSQVIRHIIYTSRGEAEGAFTSPPSRQGAERRRDYPAAALNRVEC